MIGDKDLDLEAIRAKRRKWNNAWCRKNRNEPEHRAAHADYDRLMCLAFPEYLERRRRRFRVAKYGLEYDDFLARITLQAGKCAICNIIPTKGHGIESKLHVDHDHVTGEVRGLLCQSCNQAMGFMKDSVQTLKSAIKYLEKHNNKKKET